MPMGSKYARGMWWPMLCTASSCSECINSKWTKIFHNIHYVCILHWFYSVNSIIWQQVVLECSLWLYRLRTLFQLPTLPSLWVAVLFNSWPSSLAHPRACSAPIDHNSLVPLPWMDRVLEYHSTPLGVSKLLHKRLPAMQGRYIVITLYITWKTSKFNSFIFYTSIVEIAIVSPLGTDKSELLPTSNAKEWYITTTWIPTSSLQYGPNILCYMAIDSRK